MKNLSYFLIILIVFSCQKPIDTSKNDELSLNGDWKFHTIYGEGANYMNVKETENDIIIDNLDEDIEIRGKWNTSKKGIRFSRFYKEDYLKHHFPNKNLENDVKKDSSYFRFLPNFKKSGFYEVFTMFPFASHTTTQYNVKHANGLTTNYKNHRTFCGEWYSIGIYEFNKDEKNYVELTGITEGVVAADAMLFRPITKEKYKQAKREPSQVFKPNFDDSNWYNLKVPGHWGMLNKFSNYTGIGWYRRKINLPESWVDAKNNRYYLQFDGVYHVSKIYLNGKFIGTNRGGFTPFKFDVTDVLNYSDENVLAVQADNSAIVGATWNWGGIIRDVTLSKKKDIHIDYQYIHANPDLKTGDAELKLKLKVENNSSEKRTININSKIIDDKEIATLNGKIEVDANATKIINLTGKLVKDKVELWHFDNPKLYKIKTTISEKELVLDAKEDNFGIRKVELTKDNLILNGEPVRLAGFNRVSESRFWGSSEPLEVLEEDVDLMKEAGANFMRIMHGTQNKRLFDICDRKGILLFEEVNVRNLDNDEFRANYKPLASLKNKGNYINNPDAEILNLDEPYIKVSKTTEGDKNYLLAKYWLKGMIERDFNHPSVIGWSVGNELNNHFEYGKEAINFVKELDPYRLVTCVSNSGQKEAYTQETDPNTFVDLIMHNMYRWQGKPQEILNTLRTKWPNKPIFISEYGFDPFQTTSPNADKEIFSEWMNNFRGKNDFVVGTSMWTFNDYRSGYAGTTAEENRVWGVITTWREKRRLFHRLKKEHAPVKDIQISSINFSKNTADVSIPIKSISDYPSHSMTDYKLVYQFKNTEGKVVFEDKIDLPKLTPEDKIWKGKLSWKTLPKNILDLNVKLVAPTNYTRFTKTVSFQKAIQPKVSKVILGDESARILFDKVPNATEYWVTYYDDKGKEIASEKTITSFIDVENLSNNKAYAFKLYAINDKGKSIPSIIKNIQPNGKPMPPIIWDSFITDNKLVIGYSSHLDDEDYTVKYGTSKENLDQEFITNVRGMMSIDLKNEDTIFFKMRSVFDGKESNWSQIVKASKK